VNKTSYIYEFLTLSCNLFDSKKITCEKLSPSTALITTVMFDSDIFFYTHSGLAKIFAAMEGLTIGKSRTDFVVNKIVMGKIFSQ
jgi:hypothetical protein